MQGHAAPWSLPRCPSTLLFSLPVPVRRGGLFKQIPRPRKPQSQPLSGFCRLLELDPPPECAAAWLRGHHAWVELAMEPIPVQGRTTSGKCAPLQLLQSLYWSIQIPACHLLQPSV